MQGGILGQVIFKLDDHVHLADTGDVREKQVSREHSGHGVEAEIPTGTSRSSETEGRQVICPNC